MGRRRTSLFGVVLLPALAKPARANVIAPVVGFWPGILPYKGLDTVSL
jgi:hypothetical protein